MIIFDNYLCEKFQKLSDWLQDTTGKTCFWYATALCVVSSFLYLLESLIKGQSLGIAASFFSFVVLMVCIEVQRSRTSPGKMIANALRHHVLGYYLRMYFMATFIFNIYWLFEKRDFPLSRTGSLLDLCMIYFLSCTPRPWSKSVVGKWIDSLAHTLFGKFIPQGT